MQVRHRRRCCCAQRPALQNHNRSSSFARQSETEIYEGERLLKAETLRVGLVGCGGMGHEHLKIMARIPGVRIVGVCDHRPERARRMSEGHRLPCWTDYPTFLEEARLQAV